MSRALLRSCRFALLVLGASIFACRHSPGPAASVQTVTSTAPEPVPSSEAEPRAAASPNRRALGLFSLDVGLSREEAWAAWNSLRGDAYELDPIRRFLEDGEKPDCKAQTLVRHAGGALRYARAVHVNPPFRERLLRFEDLVVEVAREIYGRPPLRLRHAGAFSCRSSRNRSYRLSEHALGNAIDVLGFDFGAAPRREPWPEALAPALKKPFQVRVERHWQEGTGAAAATHTAFLRALAERLEARHDVFRGMIGPSHRNHADHFHFDMAPWRYVHF